VRVHVGESGFRPGTGRRPDQREGPARPGGPRRGRPPDREGRGDRASRAGRGHRGRAAGARPACGADPAGAGPGPVPRGPDREGAVMLQAVVVGNVWSTKRIDGLPSGALLEVEVTGSGERLVAFDVLGGGQGERGPVAQGAGGPRRLPGRPPGGGAGIRSRGEPPPAPPPPP